MSNSRPSRAVEDEATMMMVEVEGNHCGKSQMSVTLILTCDHRHPVTLATIVLMPETRVSMHSRLALNVHVLLVHQYGTIVLENLEPHHRECQR